MFGFWGWFLAFVIVMAIFYAEKLPDLQALLEHKFKVSLEAAKTGSKIATNKLKQAKNELDKKKRSSAEKDDADVENTPEEIAESLKFMGTYIDETQKGAPQKKKRAVNKSEASATEEKKEEKHEENKPTEKIDLENFNK